MIIDPSAIMAVVLREPEKVEISAAMLQADRLSMSAANWVELQAVLTRRGNPVLESDVERLFDELNIVIAPLTVAQAQTARLAYRQFGRGTKHRADLNFGDCFAYALAKATREPLLFKGEDFALTDITPALPRAD